MVNSESICEVIFNNRRVLILPHSSKLKETEILDRLRSKVLVNLGKEVPNQIHY